MKKYKAFAIVSFKDIIRNVPTAVIEATCYSEAYAERLYNQILEKLPKDRYICLYGFNTTAIVDFFTDRLETETDEHNRIVLLQRFILNADIIKRSYERS